MVKQTGLQSFLKSVGLGCLFLAATCFFICSAVSLFFNAILSDEILANVHLFDSLANLHPLIGLLLPVLLAGMMTLRHAPLCLMIRSEPVRMFFPWTFLLVKNTPISGEPRSYWHYIRRSTFLIGCSSILLLLPVRAHGLLYWVIGGISGHLLFWCLINYWRCMVKTPIVSGVR
jgi:hypothetical protein